VAGVGTASSFARVPRLGSLLARGSGAPGAFTVLPCEEEPTTPSPAMRVAVGLKHTGTGAEWPGVGYRVVHDNAATVRYMLGRPPRELGVHFAISSLTIRLNRDTKLTFNHWSLL
jgi:hypothetical protein